ncbi:expressed unknown protein [Seminavis robusta]|uniref:Uncharacterized protein n=1 Tax=Seminavis robusta TaxID=568900 RepID=A0A9N8HCJ9_9STRA|nr:expressed unknown protein [Seminavis robusta]|eukprot:Sro385_g131750.1 n/a (1520) ;mRNA; f:56143-60702
MTTKQRDIHHDKPQSPRAQSPWKIRSISGIFAVASVVSALVQFGVLHKSQDHLPAGGKSSVPVDKSFLLNHRRGIQHGGQQKKSQRRRQEQIQTSRNHDSVKEKAKIVTPRVDVKPNELKLPTPIIVMGLPKMGGSTIYEYFKCGLDSTARLSQYDCKPGKDPDKIGMSCGKHMRRNLEKEHEPAFTGMDTFDVYAQLDAHEKKGGITLPQWAYLQEIRDQYPSATWILNTREKREWVHALDKWGDLRQRLIDHHIYPEFSKGVGAKDIDMIIFARMHEERVKEFAQSNPSLHLVEVKIDDPNAGQSMEATFGISKDCWIRKKRASPNVPHDADSVVYGKVVSSVKPTVPIIRQSPKLKKKESLNVPHDSNSVVDRKEIGNVKPTVPIIRQSPKPNKRASRDSNSVVDRKEVNSVKPTVPIAKQSQKLNSSQGGIGVKPGELKLPTPIIVLGLPKMGGSTIYEYFKCGLDSTARLSQYDCKPGKDPDKIGMSCGKHMRRNLEKEHEPAFAGMDTFDVYAQLDAHEKKGGITLPQWAYLQEIRDQYPSATWILNTREKREWVHALDKWGDLRQRLIDHHIYPEFSKGVGTKDIDMNIFARMHEERVKEFAESNPSIHLVEVKIDDPHAGQSMEDAFGVSKDCWIRKKRASPNVPHDADSVVDGKVVSSVKPTVPIIRQSPKLKKKESLNVPHDSNSVVDRKEIGNVKPTVPIIRQSPKPNKRASRDSNSVVDRKEVNSVKPTVPIAKQSQKLNSSQGGIGVKPGELKLPTPILVMGLPKAGTTSIYTFFECGLDANFSRISHYDCKPGKDPEKIGMSCGKKMRRNLEKYLKPVFYEIDDFDVYAELDAQELKGGITLPQWAYLQEIHDHFPNATWIMNTRDEKDWIHSLDAWGSLRQRFIDKHIYPEFPAGVGAKDSDMIAFSHLQAQRVREFARSNPSHHLVEVKIDSPDAGKIMADAFGISTQCWSRKNVNKDHILEHESDSFAVDSLCGGCRSILMDHLERGIHRERCGIKIYKDAKEQNLTILEAARLLVQNPVYGADCLPCLQCKPADRRYWRYDHAAVPYENPKTYYLSSIPDENRIPRTVLADSHTKLTKYFLKLNAVSHNKPKQYLFEYNPTIVPLPSSMTFPKLEKDNGKIAYISSFRVATQQGCFNVGTTLQMIGGEWENPERRPEKKDYLGLALMKEDLSVVAEIVIDLPRRFRKREDFRLFVLHGQLYISSYCKLTPLWVKESSGESNSFSLAFDRTQTKVDAWQAINVFPSPLRAWIGADITQCATEELDNMHFKNLNYFVSASGDTMVETFPLGPHIVRPVHHVLNSSAPAPTRADDFNDTITALQPSYYTVDELILAREMSFFESGFTQDRGGACCSRIVNPRKTNQTLWLGISHVKTPHGRKKLEKRGLQPNQYLSRWYAFEQTPPFKTVAMSGGFCWPSPKAGNATGDAFNPLAPHSAPWNHFNMGSLKHIKCPAIHFVSGMTEKLNDPETLIVALGVADCTPWFVEVKKADIIQRLFEGPPT